jgi:hypothetical protein
MSKFKRGDRVRISTSNPDLAQWNGFEVVYSGSGSTAQHFKNSLTPLSPRPDGRGYYPFYWSEDDLRLVTSRTSEEVISEWAGRLEEFCASDGRVSPYSYTGFLISFVQDLASLEDNNTEASN